MITIISEQLFYISEPPLQNKGNGMQEEEEKKSGGCNAGKIGT